MGGRVCGLASGLGKTWSRDMGCNRVGLLRSVPKNMFPEDVCEGLSGAGECAMREVGEAEITRPGELARRGRPMPDAGGACSLGAWGLGLLMGANTTGVGLGDGGGTDNDRLVQPF